MAPPSRRDSKTTDKDSKDLKDATGTKGASSGETKMSGDDIQRIIDNLSDRIEKAKQETVASLKIEIETLAGSIHELQVDNQKLKGSVERLQNKQSEAQEEIDSLKGIVKAQAKTINDLEQYGRRSNVKIYGLKETGVGEEGVTASETMEAVERLCKDMRQVETRH